VDTFHSPEERLLNPFRKLYTCVEWVRVIFNLPLKYGILQAPVDSFKLCGVSWFWVVNCMLWRVHRDQSTSPWCSLLEFDLAGFLDQVTNVTATGSEEVGTNVTGDIVAAASVLSVKRL